MKERLRPLTEGLAYDVLGGTLYSLGYYTFATNGGFATGGVSGLALMINYFTHLPMGALTVAMNLPIVLLTFRSLGKKFLLRSLRSLLIITLIMDGIMPHFPVYSGDLLLACLFTGLLVGAGMGLIYTQGSSTGGSDFVVMAVRKARPYLSLGQITAVMDVVVILAGWPVYGSPDAVLYGLVFTFVSTFAMDYVVNGAAGGKMALVVTRSGAATAKAISDEVGRGATLMPGKGSYTGRDMDVLLCACGKMEIARVRRIAHQMDPHAMVMICDAAEVVGEGFTLPEDAN